MKVKDFKKLDLAINQALDWGVSNTHEINGLSFFVSYESSFFKIVIFGEAVVAEQEIHFRSVETLYKFFCR